MTEKEIYAYVAEHCPYCALCGCSWNLHIHHLIRLCEHCHLYVVHANMKLWMPRLQHILEEIIIIECHYDIQLYEQNRAKK